MTNDQARRIAFLALRLKKERGYAFTQGASDQETKDVERLIERIVADHAKCWACDGTGMTEEETSGGRFLSEYCGCKIGRERLTRDERAKNEPGRPGRESFRSVFLALDADGLVKVWKELRIPETSRLGLIASEAGIHERVGPTPGLPRYYGTTEVKDGIFFLRMGVCYGTSLDGLGFLLPQEAEHVIGRLAGTLASLHRSGVVYNDLRPSNVKIDGGDVHLLDLGDAQFIPHGKREVTTYVHGPRYVAPEVVLRHKAQPASDVFQLGIVWHELLTGRHPFSSRLPHEEDYELLRLRDCLANVMMPAADCGNELLSRMLDADPARRPPAAEVANALKGGVTPVIRSPRPPRSVNGNGTVLFPARIGIPHRGHVDYMARLLELGYDLVVSLNAAYVLTPLDPLPKWTVMKMIGRSLARRGLDPGRVTFLCTPLFDEDDQIGLHLALMPGHERIVAVASGNHEVHRRFSGWPILDQAAVFGVEGEPYETRSWGERLREAVRAGNRAVFDDLIAPGAEEILNFEEMRAYCSRPAVDYAWGRGRGHPVAVARDEEGAELVRARISTYSTPEDAIAQALGAAFVDRFSRDSVVRIGSKDATLLFEDAAPDGQNLAIFYRVKAVEESETSS